jgi:hypothetical protein
VSQMYLTMVVVTTPATTRQEEVTEIVTVPVGGLSIGAQTVEVFTADGDQLALLETSAVRSLNVHWEPVGEQLGLRVSRHKARRRAG